MTLGLSDNHFLYRISGWHRFQGSKGPVKTTITHTDLTLITSWFWTNRPMKTGQWTGSCALFPSQAVWVLVGSLTSRDTVVSVVYLSLGAVSSPTRYHGQAAVIIRSLSRR